MLLLLAIEEVVLQQDSSVSRVNEMSSLKSSMTTVNTMPSPMACAEKKTMHRSQKDSSSAIASRNKST